MLSIGDHISINYKFKDMDWFGQVVRTFAGHQSLKIIAVKICTSFPCYGGHGVCPGLLVLEGCDRPSCFSFTFNKYVEEFSERFVFAVKPSNFEKHKEKLLAEA